MRRYASAFIILLVATEAAAQGQALARIPRDGAITAPWC